MNYAAKVSPSARTAGWSGIAAIVLIIGGFGMMSANGLNGDPELSASAAADLVKHEISAAAKAGLFLDVAGSILFMIFAVGLWARLRQAEGDPGGTSMLVLVAAVLANAAAVGDKAGFYAITLRAGRGLEASDAQVIYALIAAFFLLFRAFTGLLAGAAAVVVLRTRALPRWTAWLGIVLAGASALAVAAPNLAVSQATFMLFPLWMLSVSVSMIRGAKPVIGATRTAPAM